MVKHTQTIRRLDHFVGLEFKELIERMRKEHLGNLPSNMWTASLC